MIPLSLYFRLPLLEILLLLSLPMPPAHAKVKKSKHRFLEQANVQQLRPSNSTQLVQSFSPFEGCKKRIGKLGVYDFRGTFLGSFPII